MRLYRDVIESVSFTGGPSVTVKSHHNAGRLPARMNMKLVEACANCSRTRCACWAVNSACPKSSSAGIRSAGPGLAIRCPGDVTKEKFDTLRNADAVYTDQIRKAGLYDQIW